MFKKVILYVGKLWALWTEVKKWFVNENPVFRRINNEVTKFNLVSYLIKRLIEALESPWP